MWLQGQVQAKQPPQKKKERGKIKSQQSRQTQDTKRHRRHFPTNPPPINHPPTHRFPPTPHHFCVGKRGVAEGLLMWLLLSATQLRLVLSERLTFHSRHDIFTLSLFVLFIFFLFVFFFRLCCAALLPHPPPPTAETPRKTLVELTFSGCLKVKSSAKVASQKGKLKIVKYSLKWLEQQLSSCIPLQSRARLGKTRTW